MHIDDDLTKQQLCKVLKMKILNTYLVIIIYY